MQAEIALLMQEHQNYVCPLLALVFALATYVCFSTYSKIPMKPLSGWGIAANLGGLVVALFGVLFTVCSFASLCYLADSWYLLGVLIGPEAVLASLWLIYRAFGGHKMTP